MTCLASTKLEESGCDMSNALLKHVHLPSRTRLLGEAIEIAKPAPCGQFASACGPACLFNMTTFYVNIMPTD
jgi:hypothetical protein